MTDSYTLQLPVRIVASEHAENTQALLREKAWQIDLIEPEVTQVSPGGYVILDYGKELAGGLRLMIHTADSAARVRLRLGESLSECCAELGEKNAQNAHAYRDITLPAIMFSDSDLFDSGFRFARIDVLDGKIAIKALAAKAWDMETARDGSFRCSDDRLNQIYETAARTVELCVRRGYIWDGIKRDRLVWIGDLYPELLGLENLTRDLSCVRRSLAFAASQTPADVWMGTIPEYTLWWIINLHEYCRRTGDGAFLHEQKGYVNSLVENFARYVDEDGVMHTAGNLVDWACHETPDEIAGEYAIAVLGLSCAREILTDGGLDSSLCDSLLARLKPKAFPVKEKKSVLALKYRASGVLSEEEKQKILAGGGRDMSPFMGYFQLCAHADIAGLSHALDILREYYGAMLDLGATTFWEHFDLDWVAGSAPIDRFREPGEKDIHGDHGTNCYTGLRHSLCHGWGAGVIGFMVQRILGVQVEAGGKTVTASPDLGGLAFAEGDIPLQSGIFHIRIDENGVQYTAPEGVTVIRR